MSEQNEKKLKPATTSCARTAEDIKCDGFRIPRRNSVRCLFSG